MWRWYSYRSWSERALAGVIWCVCVCVRVCRTQQHLYGGLVSSSGGVSAAVGGLLLRLHHDVLRGLVLQRSWVHTPSSSWHPLCWSEWQCKILVYFSCCSSCVKCPLSVSIECPPFSGRVYSWCVNEVTLRGLCLLVWAALSCKTEKLVCSVGFVYHALRTRRLHYLLLRVIWC